MCELQKTGVGSLRSANFKIVSGSANFCDRGGSGGDRIFVIFHFGNYVIDLIAYGKMCLIPLVCLCKSCLLQR